MEAGDSLLWKGNSMRRGTKQPAQITTTSAASDPNVLRLAIATIPVPTANVPITAA
jgi:hypothetical protein